METRGNDNLSIDQQLCFALYAASRLLIQAYGPLLNNLGLTYSQYLVLLVLWETGPVSVKDIGTQLFLDSGTLSPLLKKLKEKGLISKSRKAKDERIVSIVLTQKGKSLKKKVLLVPQKMFCQLNMSEMQFVNLREQLKKLT